MREAAGSGGGGGTCLSGAQKAERRAGEKPRPPTPFRPGRAQSQASSDFSVHTNCFSVLHLHQFELDLYLITKSPTKIIKYTLKYCYLLVSGATFALANTLWALRCCGRGLGQGPSGRVSEGPQGKRGMTFSLLSSFLLFSSGMLLLLLLGEGAKDPSDATEPSVVCTPIWMCKRTKRLPEVLMSSPSGLSESHARGPWDGCTLVS